MKNDFLTLSKQFRVSEKTLLKIYEAAQKLNKKEFLAKELAAACGKSSRNMDKILQKIEEGGGCEIICDLKINERGRPCRVIKITYF